MTQPQPAPTPPSVQLLEMLFGFTLARSISVAAQLGIADLVKHKPQSAEELARSTGTHSRSLYRLLRALAGAGIFSEGSDGRFGLTELGQLLTSDAKGSLRSFAALIADHVNFQAWAELPYAIQTGQPAFPHKFGQPFFAWLEGHPEEARSFNDAMTSMSANAADAVLGGYDFSGIKKLVDVGGGHGLFLAAILAKYPAMRGVLYDAPS